MLRFWVYVGESAVLSVPLWLALALTLAALRNLGWSTSVPGLRIYLHIWASSLAVDALGSEVWGPEFLFLYKLASLAPVLGAALWMFAVIRRRWRAHQERVSSPSSRKNSGEFPQATAPADD